MRVNGGPQRPQPPVTRTSVTAAFRDEGDALAFVTGSLSPLDLARPSPCPPWLVAGLLAHIVIAAGRIGPAIEAAGYPPGDCDLVDAAGYYRPGERFSAAVNADRIDIASALARRLGDAAAIQAALAAACQDSLTRLESAPPDQEARTRHGDQMLLTDFAVTRVVELAVHGLDVAAGLGRPPWLTDHAAAVVEALLLPGGSAEAAVLRDRLECDRAGLIARLTGRAALTGPQAKALADLGVTRLALG
jgi:uncharacterized protein (TIGR03083 family)